MSVCTAIRRGLILLATLLFLGSMIFPAGADPRVVRPGALLDGNANRISDHLEQGVKAGKLTSAANGSIGRGGLVVLLDHAPDKADFTRIRALGASAVKSWNRLVYAVHVKIPPSASLQAVLDGLSKMPGVTYIDENAVGKKTLYLATKQIGARSIWVTGSGYEGASDEAIAILDTGIDGTHTDFAGRIAAWVDWAGASKDVPGDTYATPTDMDGHGTHVAGIAAGSGAAARIATGVGQVPITFPSYFSPAANNGWLVPFPIDTYGGAANLEMRLKWSNTATGHNVGVGLFDENQTLKGSKFVTSTSAQPMSYIYSGLTANLWEVYAGLAVSNINSDNTPYWLQIRTPLSAWEDGKNLMRGVAPGCKLIGLKVMDDQGTGYSTDLLNGLDWVAANKSTHKIVSLNASMGFSSVVPIIDTAVNNLVAQGVVCVFSAGNSRSDANPYVGSPASASKSIAVAAMDDGDAMTDYSSIGSPGTKKPDITSPGGSYTTGRLMISTDTNSADTNDNPADGSSTVNPDAFPNDYIGLQGTSMASPVIAGCAALVAQAMGTWSFTESQALRVKMVLLMTATETNQTAQVPPDPTLDRGARDSSEGFGRVNVQAAVEALTQSYTLGSSVTGTLGASTVVRKCWAKNVTLTTGTAYHFDLTVPPGADYDLYLYQDSYTTTTNVSNDSAGDPIIAASSAGPAVGGAEATNYTPSASGKYYLVVKWVSGSGDFTLSSSATSTTFATTGQMIRTGWNLVSLPGQPENGNPLVVFSGIDVANSSFQFWKNNSNAGGYQSYGSLNGWTGPVVMGTPYWFLNAGAPTDVSFKGTPVSGPQTITFPALSSAPHWVMFGHMRNAPTACTLVTFSSASHPTPLAWQAAYDAGIVDGKAMGFNNATSAFFTAGPPVFFTDRANLEPWYGYWLLLRTNEAVTMTFPAP